MADALASGASTRKGVQVQLLSSAFAESTRVCVKRRRPFFCFFFRTIFFASIFQWSAREVNLAACWESRHLSFCPRDRLIIGRAGRRRFVSACRLMNGTTQAIFDTSPNAFGLPLVVVPSHLVPQGQLLGQWPPGATVPHDAENGFWESTIDTPIAARLLFNRLSRLRERLPELVNDGEPCFVVPCR